ncbi:MAG: hypothetical protein C0404_03440 [Verrucomicrobia bacterium]|nr:hypothetical protein [Verrucomicrobiota bacterium]
MLQFDCYDKMGIWCLCRRDERSGAIMMKLSMVAMLALGVTAQAVAADPLDLKLQLSDVWGQGGHRYITGGVPLLAGQTGDSAQLHLATRDAEGNLAAVPAQFRTLAKWWRADNSIRWVLVDFATDVPAGSTKEYILTTRDLRSPEPAGKLAVDEREDEIVVSTGVARFTISRKKFAFLDKVWVDANGDGQYGDDELVLTGSPDLGIVVEDTYGEKYYSSEGTRSVEVIERGPMRVCVRARGVNKAREGRGYSRGMYSYDVFLNFYAGGTDVNVDLVLGNHPAKSTGSPTFEDASLILKTAATGMNYRLVGEKALDGKLKEKESVRLYQDSNGSGTWESCAGYDDNDQKDGWSFPKGLTSSFRGFRVYKQSDGKEETVGTGDHARGLLHVYSEKGGLIVHTRHFWQQFPKAIEVSCDGIVRLGIFPREYKVPHFLEDTTAKGHEIVLHFYARGRKGPYPLDSDGRPDPELIAGLWDGRVLPRPELAHIAAAGALADLGPFTPPTGGLDQKPDTRNCAEGPRMLTEDYLYGNSYGWQVFGERWRSQGGGGKQGARQPMDEDNYLRKWYFGNPRDWLAAGDNRSRHFRDVRGYRIEDQDPFGFKSWDDFKAANMSEERLERPQPSDDEYKKYTQGLWKRVGFWLPNPEHMVLDLLYDRYLLMGDVRCFENMKIIAAHGGYFAAYHEPVIYRAQGWGWRALDRYWELTGDKDAERMLKRVIQTYKPLIGKPPLICGTVEKPNWWFTTIFSRALAMNALNMGDPDALELARTMAVDKTNDASQVKTLFAVLYHLTGEESYKKAVFRKTKPDEPLGEGHYLYICDHWLLNQPPRVKPAQDAVP